MSLLVWDITPFEEVLVDTYVSEEYSMSIFRATIIFPVLFLCGRDTGQDIWTGNTAPHPGKNFTRLTSFLFSPLFLLSCNLFLPFVLFSFLRVFMKLIIYRGHHMNLLKKKKGKGKMTRSEIITTQLFSHIFYKNWSTRKYGESDNKWILKIPRKYSKILDGIPKPLRGH
jgi:hypothetical protein